MSADVFQVKKGQQKLIFDITDDLENMKCSQNWKWACVPERTEEKDRYYLPYQTVVGFLGCLFAFEQKYSPKWKKL